MPVSSAKKKIAIIGAGIAGSNLAYNLDKEKFEIELFDKARGAGGRTSSRRVTIGNETLKIDHGAQYIDLNSSEFQTFLDKHVEFGNIVHLSDNKYCVIPSMNAIAKFLVDDPQIKTNFATRVKKTELQNDKHILFAEDESILGEYDFVVSTAPPRQTEEIMLNFSKIKQHACKVMMKAHYALMLVSNKKHDFGFDYLNVKDSVLNWIGVNSNKEKRNKNFLQLILHSNFEWTAKHLHSEHSIIIKHMLDDLQKITGFTDAEPEYLNLHRWLYGRTLNPLNIDFILDEENKVAVCADWCLGDDIEAAYLSSFKLSKTLNTLY